MENCVLVIPTFSKRHQYLSEVIAITKLNLVLFDKIVIITDTKGLDVQADVIVESYNTWADVIYNGLKKVKNKYNTQYVFILLEDLLPFEPVNSKILLDNYLLMQGENYPFISYRTYEFGDLNYDTIIDNQAFYKFTDKFLNYCQLQPGFWKLDYLLQILEALIAKNEKSPWLFEFHRTNEIHLMSEYKWPNVMGGFVEGGFVNRKALAYAKQYSQLRGLYKLLYKQYIKERPKYLAKRYGYAILKRLGLSK